MRVFISIFIFFSTFIIFGCNQGIFQRSVSQILIEDIDDPSFDEGSLRPDRRSKIDSNNDRRSRQHCTSSRRDSDTYFIFGTRKRLDDVDSGNAGSYELKGKCKNRRGQAIELKVNGYSISNSPICDRREIWKTKLDLTPIARTGEDITFQVETNQGNEQGNESECTTVKVYFDCPENYISISPLADYYEDSFCVMKYEAKFDEDNKKAISKPEGKPIARVSHFEAIELCENNGPRYGLISNNQWQNIARSIESVDENWSDGNTRVSNNNMLNCGNSSTLSKEADESNACSSRSPDCDSARDSWHADKRTHILPDGEVIWDICGNVGEIMRDKHTASSSFTDPIFELEDRTIKEKFGPRGNYNLLSKNNRNLKANNYFNLGYVDILKGANKIVVRGGGVRGVGIFSVHSQYDGTRISRTNIGFRCVYIP